MSAPHRLDVGEWSVWRDFALRSAGFPVELLDELGAAADAGAAIQRLARLPRFREALAWQNRSFLRSGLAWLERHPERGGWRARANRRTALLYLQRYAARNETVGFFGPLAWGRFEAEGAALALDVGRELEAGRRLEWESWALDAFARRFGLALGTGTASSAPARMDAALAGAPKTSDAESARDAWRALEQARARLAAAAGDAALVERAMGELERAFTEHTGAGATRAHGRQYAGRTVVREDCGRAVALTAGPDVWRRAGTALDWLFRAQRWVAAGAGRTWAARLEQVFAPLAGAGRAPFRPFFARAHDVLEGLGARRDPEVAARAAEARQRVRALLAIPPGARRVERSAAALSAAAAKAFPDERPGWPSARYHCPDLHLAAPSVARAAGAPLVLGELHSAKNTVDLTLFAGAHPDPARLAAALASDLGPGRVRPAAAADWPNAGETPLHPDDVVLDWTSPGTAAPRERVVTLDELEVVRAGGALRVASRDGRDWALLAFFDAMLGGFGAMLPHLDHVPRITVDGVVVARESWRVAAAALDFAREPTESARRAGAARLAGELGLPRRVFVRTPREPKPIYLDLAAAPFVELLAWLAQDAPSVQLTEMLPGPEDCWLTDADGRHYTSELRLVFLDPA